MQRSFLLSSGLKAERLSAVIVEISFPFQCCGIHMSGINIIFSGKFAYPQNGTKFLIDVAAGKIGSVAAAAEESISAENGIFTDQ